MTDTDYATQELEVEYFEPNISTPVGLDRRELRYISGPMTGIEDFNYPFFERITNWLEREGFNIETPHRNPAPQEGQIHKDKIYEYYMDLCKKQVLGGIILLWNFANSPGATRELSWAVELGRPIYFFDDRLGILTSLGNISEDER